MDTIKETKEFKIFNRHLAQKGLKHSGKRDVVLDRFLQTQRHVSVEELHELVCKEHPEIGYTTVYRTMKLIVSCGLAEKVDFDDGMKRYERKVGREYHAHFICTKCGNNFEMFDRNIQKLSARLSENSRFEPQKHRLEIFGLCKNCH